MEIESIRKKSSLVFDVHLMIEEPARYLNDFKDAGADIVTVHAESCRHLHSTIMQIKALGMKAGVALNPATPVSVLDYILQDIDMVLVMSVNPGAGGQSFIAEVLPKIEWLKKQREAHGYTYEIEIDGGINADTAKLAAKAGADILVSGSSVFKASDPKDMIARMHGAEN